MGTTGRYEGRLRLGGLWIYLERTLASPAPLAPGVVPRPYGVAPAVPVPGESTHLSSVVEGEAVWLGFQAVDPQRSVIVRIRLDEPVRCDATTGQEWQARLMEAPRNYLIVPPATRLVGVPRENGVHCFTPPTQLTFLVGTSQESLRLIPPAEFERSTNLKLHPLDRSSGYTGWRAP